MQGIIHTYFAIKQIRTQEISQIITCDAHESWVMLYKYVVLKTKYQCASANTNRKRKKLQRRE